jgi:hypothetical protein
MSHSNVGFSSSVSLLMRLGAAAQVRAAGHMFDEETAWAFFQRRVSQHLRIALCASKDMSMNVRLSESCRTLMRSMRQLSIEDWNLQELEVSGKRILQSFSASLATMHGRHTSAEDESQALAEDVCRQGARWLQTMLQEHGDNIAVSIAYVHASGSAPGLAATSRCGKSMGSAHLPGGFREYWTLLETVLALLVHVSMVEAMRARQLQRSLMRWDRVVSHANELAHRASVNKTVIAEKARANERLLMQIAQDVLLQQQLTNRQRNLRERFDGLSRQLDQTRQRRSELEESVRATVQDARRTLDAVDKQDIVKLRAASPVDALSTVVMVACVTLSAGARVMDCEQSWGGARKAMGNADRFMDEMRRCALDAITPVQFRTAEALLARPGLEQLESACERQSPFLRCMARWVKMAFQSETLRAELGPLVERESTLEEGLRETESWLALCTSQLTDLSQRVVTLKDSFIRSSADLAHLEADHAVTLERDGRARQCCDLLRAHVESWRVELSGLAAAHRQLVGDLVVTAGLLVHGSALDVDERAHLTNSVWLPELTRRGLVTSLDSLEAWVLDARVGEVVDHCYPGFRAACSALNAVDLAEGGAHGEPVSAVTLAALCVTRDVSLVVDPHGLWASRMATTMAALSAGREPLVLDASQCSMSADALQEALMRALMARQPVVLINADEPAPSTAIGDLVRKCTRTSLWPGERLSLLRAWRRIAADGDWSGVLSEDQPLQGAGSLLSRRASAVRSPSVDATGDSCAPSEYHAPHAFGPSGHTKASSSVLRTLRRQSSALSLLSVAASVVDVTSAFQPQGAADDSKPLAARGSIVTRRASRLFADAGVVHSLDGVRTHTGDLWWLPRIVLVHSGAGSRRVSLSQAQPVQGSAAKTGVDESLERHGLFAIWGGQSLSALEDVVAHFVERWLGSDDHVDVHQGRREEWQYGHDEQIQLRRLCAAFAMIPPDMSDMHVVQLSDLARQVSHLRAQREAVQQSVVAARARLDDLGSTWGGVIRSTAALLDAVCRLREVSPWQLPVTLSTLLEDVLPGALRSARHVPAGSDAGIQPVEQWSAAQAISVKHPHEAGGFLLQSVVATVVPAVESGVWGAVCLQYLLTELRDRVRQGDADVALLLVAVRAMVRGIGLAGQTGASDDASRHADVGDAAFSRLWLPKADWVGFDKGGRIHVQGESLSAQGQAALLRLRASVKKDDAVRFERMVYGLEMMGQELRMTGMVSERARASWPWWPASFLEAAVIFLDERADAPSRPCGMLSYEEVQRIGSEWRQNITNSISNGGQWRGRAHSDAIGAVLGVGVACVFGTHVFDLEVLDVIFAAAHRNEVGVLTLLGGSSGNSVGRLREQVLGSWASAVKGIVHGMPSSRSAAQVFVMECDDDEDTEDDVESVVLAMMESASQRRGQQREDSERVTLCSCDIREAASVLPSVGLGGECAAVMLINGGVVGGSGSVWRALRRVVSSSERCVSVVCASQGRQPWLLPLHRLAQTYEMRLPVDSAEAQCLGRAMGEFLLGDAPVSADAASCTRRAVEAFAESRRTGRRFPLALLVAMLGDVGDGCEDALAWERRWETAGWCFSGAHRDPIFSAAASATDDNSNGAADGRWLQLGRGSFALLSGMCRQLA